LKVAGEQELDLVEVAPIAKPPVCKVMDYGKYRYQQSKKHSSKQKTVTVKEVKVRPQISEHDLVFKIKNVKKFLEQGNKAKITMIFRGREIVHSSSARNILKRIAEEISEIANVEQMPKMEGHRMIMVIAPAPKLGVKGE